jgi:hypothetical protein
MKSNSALQKIGGVIIPTSSIFKSKVFSPYTLVTPEGQRYSLRFPSRFQGILKLCTWEDVVVEGTLLKNNKTIRLKNIELACNENLRYELDDDLPLVNSALDPIELHQISRGVPLSPLPI